MIFFGGTVLARLRFGLSEMASFTMKWMLEVAHINGHLVLVIQMIGLLAALVTLTEIITTIYFGDIIMERRQYGSIDMKDTIDIGLRGLLVLTGKLLELRTLTVIFAQISSGGIRMATLVVWLMNGNLHTDDYSLGPTQDWKIQKTGDFNGDKYADILWRNTDGTLAIWFMYGGFNFAQAYPGTVGNDWGVTSVANFGKEH